MLHTRDAFEVNMESSSCVDKWRMRAFCQEGFFVSSDVTLVSSGGKVAKAIGARVAATRKRHRSEIG